MQINLSFRILRRTNYIFLSFALSADSRHFYEGCSRCFVLLWGDLAKKNVNELPNKWWRSREAESVLPPLFSFSTTGRPARLIKKTPRRIISAIKEPCRRATACDLRQRSWSWQIDNLALARVLPMWATRTQSTCNRKYLHNLSSLSRLPRLTKRQQPAELKSCANISIHRASILFFEKWTVQCPSSYITSIYLEESYFFPSHSSSVSLTHINWTCTQVIELWSDEKKHNSDILTLLSAFFPCGAPRDVSWVSRRQFRVNIYVHHLNVIILNLVNSAIYFLTHFKPVKSAADV